MVDYIKIQINRPDIDFLLANNNLTFYRQFSEETSEFKGKKVADHHFCKITIYDSGTVLFAGSIHKLWNSISSSFAPSFEDNKQRDKGYNGNDFKLKDFKGIRDYIEKLFNCDSSQMIIRNIEIGVNIKTTFKPSLFLRGLLYHKGKVFDSFFTRSFYQVRHQQYIIKIYDKGKQYDMVNVLRFELKYLKMKELNSCEIFTLQDLSIKTLNKAKEILLKRFDEIVYFDNTIITKKMNKKEKEVVINYKNPSYWIDDLKSNHRDRHKKNLKKIIGIYSNDLHKEIRELIIEKCVIINQ